MPLTVTLEDGHHEEVNRIKSPFVAYKIMQDVSFLKKTKLLKYIDLWGDTTFNQMQMDDLLSDFKFLKEYDNSPVIDEIIKLIIECKNDIHTYVVFYGD